MCDNTALMKIYLGYKAPRCSSQDLWLGTGLIKAHHNKKPAS